ncbi:MAG TPA: hypothetical protein IAA74_04680 [Candidatus Excrementavichristensenella intestinipullorum]|nr:hypothetical protein [Candidatus Excrementavichristensenella intestinipullorum]
MPKINPEWRRRIEQRYQRGYYDLEDAEQEDDGHGSTVRPEKEAQAPVEERTQVSAH